jgi:hypothetical protein
MSVRMPSKMTAAYAPKGASHVARRPTARPAARASWFVGKKVAKREARRRGRRYRDAATTAWSAALIYGPMAAEALGLVEQPKPRGGFQRSRPGSRSVRASCISSAATGPLRGSQENGDALAASGCLVAP